MYEMLAGERPFDAEYDAAIIYKIVNENPEPLDLPYDAGFAAIISQLPKRT